MRRAELAATAAPSFIGAWTLEPTALCDRLVAFFEANPARQQTGVVGGGVRADWKRSTDLTVRPRDLVRPDHADLLAYFEALYACYDDYLAQWPFLDRMLGRVAIGSFNLQRYLPGEHFAQIHCERSSLPSLHRVLAWMTYLNDVEAGGATHFEHYGLDVRPQKGLTLIWPADWTHAHAGRVLEAGRKYIVTGWMHLDLS